MALIVNTETRFVGYTEDGSTIFDVPDDADWNRDGRVQVLGREYVIESAREEQVVEQSAELLVSYARRSPPRESDIKDAGFDVVDKYDRGTFWIVRPSTARNERGNGELPHDEIDTAAIILPADSLKKLAETNSVTYVELNYVIQLVLPDENTPPQTASTFSNGDRLVDDAQWRRQWNMRAIGADKAWQRVREGNVIVALLGTGIDYRHTDLARNIWRNPHEVPNKIDDDGNGIVDDVVGARFTDFQSSGDPLDDHGHGTHSAGTIGAIGNNKVGIAGINWRTRLMAIKCLNEQARGRNADLIRSMYYAIDHQANVICNSWSSAKIVPSRERREALAETEQRGLLVISAAGNRGRAEPVKGNINWIRSAPNVLSVAATDFDGRLSSFSNFGPDSIGLAAPGESVVSTARSNGYRYASGTSVAAPHVAGAAALVWAANRRFKWDRVKSLLTAHVRRLPSLSDKVATRGMLDISFLGGTSQNSNEPSTTSPPPNESRLNTSQSSSKTDSFAMSQFFYGQAKTIKSDQNLLSATITLTSRMTVRLEADASFTSMKSANTFSTSFSASKSLSQQPWAESIRLVTITKPRNYVRGRSEFVVDLPAGTHTIYWRVRVSSSSNSLAVQGGGVMTIEAISPSDQ